MAGALASWLADDDWNWARPLVERVATRQIGRELRIEGGLRVDLGWRTRAQLEQLRIANVDWARGDDFLRARRLELEFRPVDWLRGRFDVARLGGEGLRVAAERRLDGADNWTLAGRSSDRAGPPRVPGEIDLRDVSFRRVDPARPEGYSLDLESLRSARLGEELRLFARGTWQHEPFSLRAVLAKVPGRGEGATPVAVELDAGSTMATARGWVGDGTERAIFEVDLSARGESLDEVWRLLGFPLPRTPPFDVTGRLSAAPGEVALRRFRGRVGASDLAGDLIVRLPPGGRMRIGADMRSRSVDLDDFEGFWGRPPREEEGGRSAAPAGSPSSIFPDLPFHFPKLAVADARIAYRADRVVGGDLIDDVRVEATLERGRLRLHPLELGLSAGRVSARGVVDATRSPTSLEADVVLGAVPLEELLRRTGIEPEANGELEGRFSVLGRGDSLHALARSLQGEAGIVLRDGSLSEPFLELLALHLGDYLVARLGDDGEIAGIRCLVGSFEADQGVLAARTLLLDTPHVRIVGRGSIDLARERIDLEIDQDSKRFTVGALRTPIVVEGPLAARRARLKKGPLLARGGAAVTLGAALHPAAALLALVDLGSDDDPEACASALRQYRAIAMRSGGARIAAERR